MLVKELIKELKKLDPNKEIEIRNYEWYWGKKIEGVKYCKVLKDSYGNEHYCFNDLDVKDVLNDGNSIEETTIKYIID